MEGRMNYAIERQKWRGLQSTLHQKRKPSRRREGTWAKLLSKRQRKLEWESADRHHKPHKDKPTITVTLLLGVICITPFYGYNSKWSWCKAGKKRSLLTRHLFFCVSRQNHNRSLWKGLSNHSSTLNSLSVNDLFYTYDAVNPGGGGRGYSLRWAEALEAPVFGQM